MEPTASTPPVSGVGNLGDVQGEGGPPSDRGPVRARDMGRAVGGGMSWMLVATVVSKLAASMTQLFLGWWLLPEHFAKFAIATTVAGFLMLSKDGGLPNLLTKQGADRYVAMSGPSFWMCLAYNSAAAALMAILAWPISTYVYQDPDLAPMLWVMACALPLGTPAAILQSKLRIDLRFKQFSLLVSISVISRQIFTILLAWYGFNELSLTLPVVITAVIDSLAAWWICNDRPWKRAAVLEMWPGLFSRTKWLINGTVGSFATEWGPYLALGKMVSDTVTGYYFFAYQITAQIGMLLSFNLHVVLLPVLAKLNDEPARQREAFVRVLRGLTLVGSYLSLAVAVVMSPVEELLWHGKWSPAVGAVVVFGVFYPWRVSFAVTCAILMAQGRFKRFSISAWGEGLMLILVTVGICLFTDNLVAIALGNGVAIVLSRLVVTAHTFRLCGLPLSLLPGAMVSGWALALIAALPWLAIDTAPQWELLAQWLHTQIHETPPESTRVATSVVAVVRAAVAGSGFTLLFTLLVRMFLSSDVRDATAMLPARARGPVQRLLRLA